MTSSWRSPTPDQGSNRPPSKGRRPTSVWSACASGQRVSGASSASKARRGGAPAPSPRCPWVRWEGQMAEPLHVAIVDDHPLFREGVAFTLGAQPDIEVVAEGESAADALRIAAERMPDVMLLDVSMPGGGLDAVRQIAAAFPVVKVVMLTVSENEDDVTAALRAGARAYVLKGVAARELGRILRAVAAGEVYVTPS